MCPNVQDTTRKKKITHCTKNQANDNLNENRYSTGINTKMNQMLELCDKDFKAAVIKVFP